MLEDNVEEKYYINTPKAKELISDLIKSTWENIKGKM